MGGVCADAESVAVGLVGAHGMSAQERELSYSARRSQPSSCWWFRWGARLGGVG